MSSATVTGTRLQAARERLAPVFARIAAHALDHERADSRPYAETRELAEAGFGALRLPVEEGGGGLSVAEYFEVLIDLAAADSNQPQLWRNHIAFVEDRLAGDTDRDRLWRQRIADGAVIGGAWSETGTASILGETRLDRVDGRLLLNGTKYYSTGSIYADWLGVLALAEDGELAIALVDARSEGIELLDDWSGFGQRSTGSGTTRLRDVVVGDDAVLPFTERFVSQEAVYQLVLLAALAGIARAVREDTVEAGDRPHALVSPRAGRTATRRCADPAGRGAVGRACRGGRGLRRPRRRRDRRGATRGRGRRRGAGGRAARCGRGVRGADRGDGCRVAGFHVAVRRARLVGRAAHGRRSIGTGATPAPSPRTTRASTRSA